MVYEMNRLTLSNITQKGIRMLESITAITLLLSALDRVDLQVIFDRDAYESRRSVLPGARLVKVLVVY
jgi:hypothetical protein